MKPFLQNCIGVSLVLLTAGFLVRSVLPANASEEGANIFFQGSPASFAGKNLRWVNIDSIDANYKAFTELEAKAGGSYNERMEAYRQKAFDLQLRYDALQQKAQMGTISADDAAQEEVAINQGMQELQQMESSLSETEKMAMEENAAITKDVTDFMKRYARRKNIDFIFGYGGSAPNLLYANDSLDITNEVVMNLNTEYALKQKKK